jgi:hypothetical protein
MKTWKQGAVGKILLKDEKSVFVKCLKYPLAVFYRNYSSESGLFDAELLYAFLNLSILPYVDRIDELKMSSADKKISGCFSIDFSTNKITMNVGTRSGAVLEADSNKLLTVQDLTDLLNTLEK